MGTTSSGAVYKDVDEERGTPARGALLSGLIRVCGYLIVARVRAGRQVSRLEPEFAGLLPRLNDLLHITAPKIIRIGNGILNPQIPQHLQQYLRLPLSPLCALALQKQQQQLRDHPRHHASFLTSSAAEHNDSSAPAAYSVALSDTFNIIFTNNGTVSACPANASHPLATLHNNPIVASRTLEDEEEQSDLDEEEDEV
ncbi:hypothetical protein Scep_018961 [Stephania cephalantha]|uniref:Uncharacterized protein n=1 Tax=Stephania cephalantha TaxID=152367 RepID=A0AAP0NKT1_9MAGN